MVTVSGIMQLQFVIATFLAGFLFLEQEALGVPPFTFLHAVNASIILLCQGISLVIIARQA